MIESSTESSSFPISLLQEEDDKIKRSFIFFCVNPSSGSLAGQQLLQAGISKMTISNPEPVEITICDIQKGPSGGKKEFQHLSETIARRKLQIAEENLNCELCKQYKIICIGGDGTIIWCLQELQKHGIDLQNISLGVIPCGTGNDFANAFNWKNITLTNFFQNSLRDLRKIVAIATNAELCKHDLWNITVVLKEDGYFSKIDSKSKKKRTVMDSMNETKKATKIEFLMSNYFSIGIESRIGRGMDKNRKKSKNLNKLQYAIEGFKNIFKKTNRIDHICEEMSERDEIIFSKANHVPKLKKAVTLAAINIPSFSAGNDIWSTSKKVGLDFPDKRKQNLTSLKQITGDGKLEFTSFSKTIDLGLEIIFKGQGRRIGQGTGPWNIKFIEADPETSVYFQVDGEFFRMSKPSHIVISYSQTISVIRPLLDRSL